MNLTLTSQLLSVSTLMAVVAAPLPMLFHILAGATVRSRVPALLAEKMLVLLVLWTVLQSLVVVLLGWIGHLRLVGILVLEGALLVWGLWLISREQGLPVRRLGRDLREGLATPPDRPPAERWLLAITCGVALLLSFRVLILPVTDGDSLWFQLPRVAQWYQQATFVQPMEQLSADIHNAYPYTWNTLFLLALAPVGHDQFVLMPNVLAWLILGLATYALGRLAGGHRFGAMFAAVLVLLMPVSVINVQTAHIDLPLGAFFVASVYFTMHGWRYRRGFSLLMALICIAMMAGTKMSGPAYIGLVAGLSLWLYLANRLADKRGPDWVPGSALVRGLVMVSIGLLGGSWYVHNALVTGNPLGFVQISVLGRVLWPGEVTQAWANKTNLLYNVSLLNPDHREILQRALANSFGLSGLVLALLALAAPFQFVSRPRVRPLLLPLLCVCLVSFYFFIATPGGAKWDVEAEMWGWYIEYNLRYGFPFWGLVGAIAGVAIRDRPTAIAAWSMVGLATLGATSAATEGWLRFSKSGLVATCAAVFVFFACSPASRRQVSGGLRRLIGRQRRKLRLTIGISSTVAVLVILITLGTAASLKVRYKLQDVLLGGISRFVDDLPADTRIGFWGTPASYLLYGKRLQHTLLYLPLHEYAPSDDMLRYLCAQPLDVIAIGPVQQGSSAEAVGTWLMKQPQHFERLHGEDIRQDVLVYRARRRSCSGWIR